MIQYLIGPVQKCCTAPQEAVDDLAERVAKWAERA